MSDVDAPKMRSIYRSALKMIHFPKMLLSDQTSFPAEVRFD